MPPSMCTSDLHPSEILLRRATDRRPTAGPASWTCPSPGGEREYHVLIGAALACSPLGANPVAVSSVWIEFQSHDPLLGMRQSSVRFVGFISHPCVGRDPVHFPGLAPVVRERLFKTA